MSTNGAKSKLKSLFSVFSLLFNGDLESFVYELSRRIPRWLFGFNSGTVMFSTAPKILVRQHDKYVYQNINPDDFNGVFELTGVPPEEISRRLRSGAQGYVAKDITDHNKVVAVQWLQCGDCYIRGFGLDLKLSDKSAYIFGAFSAPSVRLTGVYNSLLDKAISDLNNEYINDIYCLIEHHSKLNYQYCLRLNFQPLARVKYIKILGVRISLRFDLDNHKRRIKVFSKEPKAFI